ncbi:MAG: multiheme c-type cytochrome [Candidatus Electryonea clarkiae]|nr:multiheme c-type cytochrome [Candidatus Electryonea clarkiae]MDP8287885.1 multiheme c-type cytochrome [Candidatus Electryonea clarkiae]
MKKLALLFLIVLFFSCEDDENNNGNGTGPSNQAPSVPSNLSPPDSSVDNPISLTLSWTCSDPDGDTLTYDVYLDTSSNPQKVSDNQDNSTFDPGTLFYYTTYYWKVVARDNHDNETIGDLWSFTTIANHPPEIPSNPSPADSSTDVSISATLSWSCSDQDGDPLFYRVYYGDSNPPTEGALGLIMRDTTFTPELLYPNTTYYWQVIAIEGWFGLSDGKEGAVQVSSRLVDKKLAFRRNLDRANSVLIKNSNGEGPSFQNELDNSTASPVWSFTTERGENHPPNEPRFPNPEDGATEFSLVPTLSWICYDPDGDSLTYDVYFGTTLPLSPVETNLAVTTYTPEQLGQNTTHYWQIIAKDGRDGLLTGGEGIIPVSSRLIAKRSASGKNMKLAELNLHNYSNKNVSNYRNELDNETQGPVWSFTTFEGYTYLGNRGKDCAHCHGDNVTQWEESHHAEAYEYLVAEGTENNPYCLRCHTTGWDSEVSYGDTVIVEYGPDHHGYDDYFGLDTEEAAARREALEGVQCESCHGPMGGQFDQDHGEISFATRADENGESLAVCADCHHQGDEWNNSGHNVIGHNEDLPTIEFWRNEHYTSCGFECHTSEGFIIANDDDFAGWEPEWEEYNLIGCITCHDPHGGDDYYLRTMEDFTVLYDAEVSGGNGTMTGYGAGQICVQCHHARRDVDNVLEQLANGSFSFGPHGSPQMDMFVGNGSYEIEGYNYNRMATHQGLEDGCVSCHMTTVPRGEADGPTFGHDFEANIRGCTTCHPGAIEFTDIDMGAGGMAGIDAKLVQLLELIGVDDENDIGDTTLTTYAQREAAYAYAFVKNDGSRGAHNTEYANSLIDNAIDYLNTINAEHAKNGKSIIR